MAISHIDTSFAAGELSKNLYARVDLDKYHVGAALLRNFFVDYRGGASTRMGFEFIAQTKSTGNPRLLPFSFSTTQTYLLEFGDHYVRIYSNGQPLAGASGAITGITKATPGVVTSVAHGLISGQTIILNNIGGMVELNSRTFFANVLSANTFSLRRVLDNSLVDTVNYTAYTSGGTWTVPYELATPYAEADINLIKYAQSADTMTLTHPKYPPQLLQRTGASTFTMTPLSIKPSIDPPTALTGGHDNNGQYLTAYVVTAVSPDGKEESLPSAPIFIEADKLQPTGNGGLWLNWTKPAQAISQYKIYKSGPFVGLSNSWNTPSAFGFVAYSSAPQYMDQGDVPDFSRQPPQYVDPFSPGQIQGPITITAPGSGYTALSPPLITTSGGVGGGFVGRTVLDKNNKVSAAIIDVPGIWSVAPTLLISGAATATYPGLSPLTGTYPGVCGYFQQRQAFAASTNEPETIWLSQTGNVFNFDSSAVPQDSDAINVTLASRQVNEIQSMISMPTGLVLLTSGGAWLLSGGGAQLAVTPIDIAAQPQASSGASEVLPININNSILYIQARGNTVRDLTYNFYVQSFFGTDRSALANHLFFGYQITQWCYAEEPFRCIWAVRNDGVLLTLTYVPEQEVFAWSHSDSQGHFTSITSLVEGQEDAVYVIVKRNVQGVWVNFIERLHSRDFYDNVEFAFCVDSGLALPQDKPNATLTLNSPTGTATIVADNPVFSSADTGKVLRGFNGGKGTLTYISPTSCSIVIEPDGYGINSFPTTPNDPTTAALVEAGQWVKAKPTNKLRGLDQLVGKTVTGLADGIVIRPTIVSGDGTIELDDGVEASMITVGLGFQAQLQTLYIDTGEPTIQGKRKLLPRATVIVDDALGLKIGTTFDQLNEIPMQVSTGTSPPPLFSGDQIVQVPWDWTVPGQICLQQDYPMPATVLGIIPEVVVGDTGR